MGVKWIMIGHMDRRLWHDDETTEIMSKRFTLATNLGFNCLICLGETEDQRDKKETESVLDQQLKEI